MKRDRMKPRNRSKGTVRIENLDGRRTVVKDCSNIRNPLVRLYVRLTLRNELRAYTRLAGVEGIPACRGLNGQGCLELDMAPGRHLGLFKRRSVPEEIFSRLAGIVQAMHDRGVANTDLHRSNVLVAEDGAVHVIDFAHAVIARNPDRPGMLARLAMQLDWYAFARMKARFVGTPKPMPAGAFGLLYRFVKSLKRSLRALSGKS